MAFLAVSLFSVNSVNAQTPTPVLNANDDYAQTNEDVPVLIHVMSNDVFLLVNPSITSVSQPAHGQAIKQGDSIKYIPDGNYFGQDSFSYVVSNGVLSDRANVNVTILSVNDNPVAIDDSATTDEDNSVTIDVLSNDSDVEGDAIYVSSVTQGSHGSSVITNNEITYTPNPDFNGQDYFSYVIGDGNGGSDSANVVVTINPVADLEIVRTNSGLVYSDPLNNETKSRAELEADQTFWHYGGSAFSYFNPPAPTDLYKDSEGLHLGVQTTTEDTYAGYYAVTPKTDAKLFHAVITTPTRTISNQFFQNGLYVQTGNGLINYVTCVSITSQWGTSWHLIRTYGNVDQATQFEVLWSDTSSNQPLTRDCTIITNGDNYLNVYLDGNQVYKNSTMDLQMPGPFLYFLEPQNPHAEMLYGIYADYYSAKDETITVNTLADSSRVDVVSPSGNILASAPVSGQAATLDVGMYHFPLDAEIKVYDSAGYEVVTTSSEIYGGDQYAIIER